MSALPAVEPEPSRPVLVDAGLLADLKRFGAPDVSACFSCGTCTAVCPLSDNDGTFPRRMIRYAQVGMKDALLSSKELWTCYHCGLCSDTCPTQADPGEFMAAARRYAIAGYDRTRLARTMYTRPLAGWLVAAVLAVLFSAFMYSAHGPAEGSSLRLFTFVPEGLVHWTGVAVMGLLTVAGLAGVATMARAVARREGVGVGMLLGGRAQAAGAARALWEALGLESLAQRRFRAECGEVQEPEPLYRRRWLAHALTVWGFLGLLAATALDYLLALLGVKETGAHVQLWYPTRLLGTVAGLVFLYGVTVLIVNRLRGSYRAAQGSKPSDWLFLVLLWATAASGFLLELALYLPHAQWGYGVFLFHVAVALDLMLLLPFVKFAHVLYRPVALFFYALAGRRAATAG
jgi:quinone-modifying oxidoreductase, subunit QmoC